MEIILKEDVINLGYKNDIILFKYNLHNCSSEFIISSNQLQKAAKPSDEHV